MTEEQVKAYIEDQADEPGTFKVWDESEEADSDKSELQSDSSE